MITLDGLRARVAERFEPHQMGPGGDLTLNADRAAGIATSVIKPDLEQLRQQIAELRAERDAAVTNLERLLRKNAQLRIERGAARLLADIRRELLSQAVRGLASHVLADGPGVGKTPRSPTGRGGRLKSSSLAGSIPAEGTSPQGDLFDLEAS